MDELVFAIKTHELWEILSYQETGFIPGDSQLLNTILKKGFFHKRSELEEDPSYKQLIPYGVISHKNDYYLFTRTTGQTEKRLHNKLTLGVGGHMNPAEHSAISTEHHNNIAPKHHISKASYVVGELKRELFEEVRFSEDCRVESLEFVGFINDDSIEVGRMHIGLLFNICLSNKEISINETDKMTGRWVSKTELSAMYQQLETWSGIAGVSCIR